MQKRTKVFMIILLSVLLIASICITGFSHLTNINQASFFSTLFDNGKTVEGNKNVTTETREVTGPFNSITSTSSCDVYISYAEQPSIKITGESNIIKFFETIIKDNTLTISNKGGTNIMSHYPVKVHVILPLIKNIKSHGSSDTYLTNVKYDANTNISLSGSGDIKGDNIVCDNFTVNASGSGDFNIKSIKCNQLEYKESGSGDLELDYVDCQNLNSILLGSGDITFGKGTCNQAVFSTQGSGDINASHLSYTSCKAATMGSGDIVISKSGSVEKTENGVGKIIIK